MLHDVLVERALKRHEVFRRLQEHLAEGKYNYSSDIDILVVTDTPPAKVLSELWKAGIKEPFEVHVHPPEKAALYKDRAKLLRI